MRATPSTLTFSLAGVLVLAASSSAAPPTCNGVPLVGTPEEIAATPRDDIDLERLALDMSGGLTVDQAVYDRVTTDVELILAFMPEIADIPFLTGRHDAQSVLFQVDNPTWSAIQGGTYSAWDCLNDYYGLESTRLFPSIHGGSLELKGIYETTLLLPLYGKLPGFTNVEINAFGGDGPRICGIIDSSETHHYFFDDRRGDCPAGCGTFDIRYLTTSPGDARPRFQGQWLEESGEPLPPWYELYELCVKIPGPLPATVDVAPAAPTTIDGVELTVSGENGGDCGPFFNSVELDAASRTIRVVADVHCTICIDNDSPYSFDVDLGTLAAGDYEVRVIRRECGNETLLALTQLTVRASAEPAAVCSAVGQRPGATLLVPYFEVDLESPEGPNTIFSVGNAGAEPVIAHVILWTDWGLPSLDFDLHLGPDGLQTIDLRRILERGDLPRTGASASAAPGCASPIALPALDAEALAELRAKHTGLASPEDGQCHGSPTDLAVGYVTVDAMNGCSDTIRHPADDGYFEAGGTGLASNRNVLWGDVFYVDSRGDAAQGVEAVAIPAAADLFAEAASPSFYGSHVGHDGRDERTPLGHRYRARFLNGGGAGMTSEVVVWTEGFGADASPRDCLEPFPEHLPTEVRLVATFRDQKGGSAGAAVTRVDQRTMKLPVGASPLVPEKGFGQIDVETGFNCNACGSPIQFSPIQTWTMAVHRAAGRFSAAQHAARLDDGCP